MRCIFTNRTIGMTSFSIGTKPTIGTNDLLADSNKTNYGRMLEEIHQASEVKQSI